MGSNLILAMVAWNCFMISETERLYEGKIRLVGGLIGTPEEYYYVHYPGAEEYYYTESNIGYTGRLEIYHDGEWGTVCDEGFADAEAEVVCMHLDWYGGKAVGGAAYGEGEGPIWLSQVSCPKNAYYFSQCNHDDWGKNNCTHTQDVSVECDKEFIPTEDNSASEEEGASGSHESGSGVTHDDEDN